MHVLEAKAVRKQYKMGNHSVDALAGVDFLVEQGEFVAIMGPSGSGKSTLLHLIGGLDQATEGEVTIAGQPLSLLKDTQITLLRRRHVGFVFQFFNLLPTLTAEENITLPLLIDGKNPRNYQERLTALLSLIGLTDRRGHKPEQLSGGEQQRVALARALITEPAIMLADEPTGNLDFKTGTTIMELLRRSCQRAGADRHRRHPRPARRLLRRPRRLLARWLDRLRGALRGEGSLQQNLKIIMEQMEKLEF